MEGGREMREMEGGRTTSRDSRTISVRETRRAEREAVRLWLWATRTWRADEVWVRWWFDATSDALDC
jgi:hypothetical protein